MNVAIVGSREFNNYDFFIKSLEYLLRTRNIKIDKIISGGAKGADSLAEKYAKENNISIDIYYPDWNKYGKSAGYKRNIKIVENSDIIIAYHLNKSKGTQHTIDIAKKLGKRVYEYSL